MGGLDLGGAETAAATGGLDEAGEPDAVDDVLVADLVFLSDADGEAVGNLDAEGSHVVVGGELVVSEGFDEDAAGAVWHGDEVKVALQDAVLAGGSVDGDIAEVRTYASAMAVGEGKVVAVHGGLLTVGEQCIPLSCVYLYLVYIVTLVVHEGFDACGAAHADIVLGGVTSAYYCYCLFHCVIRFLHLSVSAAMSSGMGLWKLSCRPVAGCMNPSVRAWRA